MTEKKTRLHDSGPTKTQAAAAEVSIYMQSMKVLGRAAKTHAKDEHGVFGRRKYRRETRKELVGLYLHSLSSQVDQAPQDQASTIAPGSRDAKVHELFSSVFPELTTIATRTRESAADLGAMKRGKITAEVVWHINRLPEQQSEDLLKRAGYPDAKSKFIRGKLAKSGDADAITTGIALGVVTIGTGAEVLSNVVPNVTRGDLIASEVGLYAATGLVAWTNKKLMDNPRVKTTANILATAGYYFSPKLLSEKWKNTMEWVGVAVGTAVPVVAGDVAGWTAIRTLIGAQGTLGRTLVSIGIEGVTALGNLGWLAYRNRQASNSQLLQ